MVRSGLQIQEACLIICYHKVGNTFKRRRRRRRRREDSLQNCTPHAAREDRALCDGPPSGQRVSGGARNHDRWVPADLRADSNCATDAPR
ncbi:hypothetical protein PoB_003012600 [Plakobranchus ocellatus]|uniref:Uncharacterized protein n=1 Tax=Plakobranchus ocellatus TaxID=259542 RepID=A0AAV4A5T3_9GAST|nr:hypothetical protein PoB_003012600 [Plakobranchus ocellatus]